METIDYEQATDELHSLISECDAETLAALYVEAFGSIQTCEDNDHCLEVTYYKGLEPQR